MSKILDNLYLGNYSDAKNRALLQRMKITHIVTVGIELKPIFPSSFTYLYIPAYDAEDYQLNQYFEQITDFMYDAIQKQKGAVFVHCMWGISRSTTAVLAYLIKYENMGYLKARRFVKAKRSIIYPNNGFVKQLQKWETICKQNPVIREKPNDEENQIAEPKEDQQRIQNNNTNTLMVQGTQKTVQAVVSMNRMIQGPSHPTAAATTTTQVRSLSTTAAKSPNKAILNSTNTTTTTSTTTTTTSPASLEEEKSDNESNEYKCKACKAGLFSSKNIIAHKQVKPDPSNTCKFIFVDTLKWFKNTKNMTAKVSCPNTKCNEFLGLYNQFGVKCSCGFWIKDAIQFLVGKIEKINKPEGDVKK